MGFFRSTLNEQCEFVRQCEFIGQCEYTLHRDRDDASAMLNEYSNDGVVYLELDSVLKFDTNFNPMSWLNEATKKC